MSEKKKPEKKVRSGKISVSLWKHKATAMNGEEYERQRACVQHGRRERDSGKWHNQQIWLNRDELIDLTEAIDQLNEVGDKSPSSSAKSEIQGLSFPVSRKGKMA